MGTFNLAELLTPVSKQAASKNNSDILQRISRTAPMISLSVYDIIPCEDNFYSMNDIDELKSKIELAGKVLQPLVVVALSDGKYKAIAGHRRREACMRLAKEGKRDFEFVPCIVEENEADAQAQAIREEIMLIATNSQREKTAWDKLEEVRRTRLLLERIRERENITGGTREIVASALHTSPAQVGRYDAILKNLCPEFLEEIKKDQINISTAYELSGLAALQQKAAFETYQKTGEISIKSARERKQEIRTAKPAPAPREAKKIPEPSADDMLAQLAIGQLEELCLYCMEMSQRGNRERDWAADEKALVFAVERLK